MDNIYNFFKKLNNDRLKRIYEKDNQEISEMMENVYKCCFRFNLTVKQTEYILEESIRPFVGTWIEEYEK